MENILVNTPCGVVEGASDGRVRRFLGIRYATAGRWEYPVEVTHWDGVYQAHDFGAAPIQQRSYIDAESHQKKRHFHREFMEGIHPTYDEDCFFLNIWTPEQCENCPVLVVIYGGGNVSGQSDEKEFDGSDFATRGVIVVTLNYRVNIFGFMAMKELEDESGRSGNYGLYDQQMAFQWILHNIAAFGGDPGKMTLIGQSAGAANAENQIKSPINRGIFQGAILQSSAGFATVTKAKDNREAVYKTWTEVYAHSGCKSIEEFKKLPAKQLIDLWVSVSQGNFVPYAQVVADEYYGTPDKNNPCNTNIICSVTSQDTMPILFYWLCKILAKKQWGSANTYCYLFQRQLPGDDLGAWHSSDLWYTYGALEKCWRPFGEADRALSNTMMDYFANFIKTGDPNGEGLPLWEPYTKKSKRFMIFDIGKCHMGYPSAAKLLKDTILYKGPRG